MLNPPWLYLQHITMSRYDKNMDYALQKMKEEKKLELLQQNPLKPEVLQNQMRKFKNLAIMWLNI